MKKVPKAEKGLMLTSLVDVDLPRHTHDMDEIDQGVNVYLTSVAAICMCIMSLARLKPFSTRLHKKRLQKHHQRVFVSNSGWFSSK